VEGIWATHSLTGLGDTCANFLVSGAVVFWGYWSVAVGWNLSLPALALYWGSLPNYGRPPIVWLGRGDPCANFWGSGVVVFWGFGVRCGRVKLVCSSLRSILGVIAELRMPTHKGECTWATHSLTGLGWPQRQFFGVRCGSFLGLLVRCGRVKLVSSSLGSILWLLPNYGRPPMRGGYLGYP